MNNISFYNPIKIYNTNEHAKYLHEVLSNIDRKVCFFGDEAGYFFSPVRRVNTPSICFTNKYFAVLFDCLQKDINLLKSLFKEYSSGFDVDLLPYYERQIYMEKRPENIAYYTFILSILSQNKNDVFSHFCLKNELYIHESIKKLTRFMIEKNKLYWATPPDDTFIVSFKKSFNGEGILISDKKQNMRLLNTIESLNYYYKSEDK